jgi:hypothetical protein
MTRSAAFLAALAVLALPAPATADWSAPATIASGEPQVGEPAIVFGGNGLAVVSARLTTEAFGVPSRGFSRLYGQQPGGGFAGRGRIVLAAPPLAFGSSRLVMLRFPLAEGDLTVRDLEEPTTSLGYSFGRSGGSLEVETDAYRRFTFHADRNNVAIGAGSRGDVVAAWVEHIHGRDHLLVARRSPGRPFSRASVIAGTGALSSPSVAVSARGDVLVAYQRSISRQGHTADRRVEARVRRAGHSWGSAQRLGPSQGFSEIATASSATGRMVVAWGTQDGGEEANKPWDVLAAERPAGPHSFHSAQFLERTEGVARPAGTVVAAMDPAGTATVGWSGIAGARFPFTFPARAATAGSSLRFGPADTLAPSAAVTSAAADSTGAAAVAFATLPEPGNNQQSDRVFAAIRPSSTSSFATAEPVSPVEAASDPRVAFDPKTHEPAVVWITRRPGQTQMLRFSQRSG